MVWVAVLDHEVGEVHIHNLSCEDTSEAIETELAGMQYPLGDINWVSHPEKMRVVGDEVSMVWEV